MPVGSLSRAQLVGFLREVDIEGKRVLDCGAGPREKWARNWTRGEPAVYHTLDVSARFEPDFVCDLNWVYVAGDIDHSREPAFESHSTVFLLETAEHLWNPLAALVNISYWLGIGGELYFSAPFINPIHDTVDYLRLTDEWWQKAAEVMEFEVDYIKPRVATKGEGLLRKFYRAEGLRMSKIRLKAGDAHKMAHIGYFGRMVKQ